MDWEGLRGWSDGHRPPHLVIPWAPCRDAPDEEIHGTGVDAGIAERTLERAKLELRVRSVLPDGFTGAWSWTLPGVYLATGGGTPPTPPAIHGGDVPGDLAEYTDDERPWPGDQSSSPIIACQGCGMPRHPLRTCADGWAAA